MTLKGYGDRTAAYGTDFNELERLLGLGDDQTLPNLEETEGDDDNSSPLSDIRGEQSAKKNLLL